MAYTEITNTVYWATRSAGKGNFPLTAFLTKHKGVQANLYDV
jgi:hypothetical protein